MAVPATAMSSTTVVVTRQRRVLECAHVFSWESWPRRACYHARRMRDLRTSSRSRPAVHGAVLVPSGSRVATVDWHRNDRWRSLHGSTSLGLAWRSLPRRCGSSRFAEGHAGALGPAKAPRRRGAYRYVRNPMISGVLFLLVGEALRCVLAARQWALLFLVINSCSSRFRGTAARAAIRRVIPEYRQHVGRLLPRLRPGSRPARVRD